MKKQLLIITLIFVLIGSNFIGISTAAAGDQELAEQYAPILYFEQNEKCYPVDVSYALQHSFLLQMGNPVPISEHPTTEMLASYTSNDYYLDNQQGTVLAGDDGIENAYQGQMSTLGYKVYAHVDTAAGIIQYWFFYAFNGGDLNRHEGDWEMVQVLLSGGQPTQVMYSQHHGGQKALWNQVDKEENHFKVYVGRGSHANYLRSYSGKIGLASDQVGANGKVLQSSDYTIELLTTQPWLSFEGHWGWVGDNQAASVQSSVLGESGPEGPQFRESGTMWNNAWSGSLPQANDMIFVLEWLLYNFMMLFLLGVLIASLVLAFRLYRRYKRHGLGPRKFALLYIDGVNSKSIGNILCIVGMVIAIIGLFYPWYTVSADLSIPGYASQGLTDMVMIDGMHGLQVTLPNKSGPTPLGNFSLPFSILLAVGLIFLILGSIGISKSKKAGTKYLGRGIGFLLPFIVIIIVIMSLGALIPAIAPVGAQGSFDVSGTINAIAASPMSGQQTVTIAEVSGGSVSLEWGFGLGAYLLLFAAIIMIMAGLLEIVAHATFFEEREFVPPYAKLKKDKQKKKPKEPEVFASEEVKK